MMNVWEIIQSPYIYRFVQHQSTFRPVTATLLRRPFTLRHLQIITSLKVIINQQHMESVPQQSVYIWGLFNGREITLPEKQKELEGKGITNVASGGHFYIAVSATGALFGWGSAKYNRFGLSGEDINIPKLIPLKVQARIISAGNWHSMFIDSNGKLFAAGHNKQGACGTSNFETVQTYTEVNTDILAKDLACGDCYTLVITTDNEMYSCGHADLHGHKSKEHINKLKRLDIDGQKVKAVAAGFTHSLAVTEKGQTYSWGTGVFFQLGHGNKQDQKQPKAIKKLAEVKIVQVSCTRGEKYSHSMALSQNGQVYTWGAGYKGKLGHEGTWTHQNAADQPEPRMMKTIDYKVVKVSAGGIHSNILNQNGEVLSFGCGSNGRLGHSESKEYVYLYREGIPKSIESLKEVFVTNVESSYYHNICVGYRKK